MEPKEPELIECELCSNEHQIDDLHNTDSGLLCDSCYDTAYTHCDNCGTEVNRDDTRSTPNDDDYCESCYDELVTCCDSCGNTIWQNDAYDDDGNTYCNSCRKDYKPLPTTTFDIITSTRSVGIEIEYCSSSSEPPLEQWGVNKEDGSVYRDDNDEDSCGNEFASYPMAGDAIIKYVNRICDVIQKDDGYANKTCGLHVHIDVSTLNSRQRTNVTRWWQALEPIFYGLVAPSRGNNQYCRRIEGFSNLAELDNDRYRSLNVSAYHKYRTFEVRLHHGTVNPTRIINWVKLMLSFFETFKDIDATADRRTIVSSMTDREKILFLIHQTQIPLSLAKYIVMRAKKFDTLSLNKTQNPVMLPRLSAEAA